MLKVSKQTSCIITAAPVLYIKTQHNVKSIYVYVLIKPHVCPLLRTFFLWFAKFFIEYLCSSFVECSENNYLIGHFINTALFNTCYYTCTQLSNDNCGSFKQAMPLTVILNKHFVLIHSTILALVSALWCLCKHEQVQVNDNWQYYNTHSLPFPCW